MISILADNNQKQEILNKGTNPHEITWVKNVEELVTVEAEGYLDLLFFHSEERITALRKLEDRPLFIHSVTDTLSFLQLSCIRLNAWPGFLERKVIECAIADEPAKVQAGKLLSRLNWPYILLPDSPGFISGRVIAMIINEAYLALEDQVSSKSEIDLAMKNGTNYPFGPFEWGLKIGLSNISRLLTRLAETDARYQPAELLLKEAKATSPY